MAVMERPDGDIPASQQYECDCPGFKLLMIEKMCLRCLSGYADGLPYVLKEPALGREMRRVASCLARHLKDDPLLGNLPVGAALRAAERN